MLLLPSVHNVFLTETLESIGLGRVVPYLDLCGGNKDRVDECSRERVVMVITSSTRPKPPMPRVSTQVKSLMVRLANSFSIISSSGTLWGRVCGVGGRVCVWGGSRCVGVCIHCKQNICDNDNLKITLYLTAFCWAHYRQDTES